MVESVLAITFAWLPVTVFQIEMFYASQTRLILQQATFEFTRELVFGQNPTVAHRAVVSRWAEALLPAQRRHFSRYKNWFIETYSNRVEAGVSIRFPTLFPGFQQRRRSTSRCTFFFRSP